MATLAVPIAADDVETIGDAFLAALLLTANSTLAEAAVLESIRLVHRSESPSGEILRRAVEVATGKPAEISRQRPEQMAEAESMLPEERRRVLQLAPVYRSCSVLRFLAVAPRESWERLVHLQLHQVDENAGIAAEELARMVQKERAA